MSLTTPLSPFLATDSSAGIVYAPTECTVAQAAEFLDVSEDYVDEMLNAERVLFQLKNGKRMIEWNSLLEYKQRRDFRLAGLEEMIRWDQEMGLYDD